MTWFDFEKKNITLKCIYKKVGFHLEKKHVCIATKYFINGKKMLLKNQHLNECIIKGKLGDKNDFFP